MDRRVEVLVEERLRADASKEWTTKEQNWRKKPLGDFYSKLDALRSALKKLAKEFARTGLATNEEALEDLLRTIRLDARVEDLIRFLQREVVSTEDELRSHRGSGVVKDKREPFVTVRVYYATDRKPIDNCAHGDRRTVDFGPDRDTEGSMRYGTCEVTVPASHRIGRLESPKWWRFEFRPDDSKHIILRETELTGESDFLKNVSRSVSASPTRDVFVFIHGFNMSFRDAARRTAQIAFDLEFQGAPVFYSWPSRGSLLDYASDEASVIWTVPHLERFLESLAADTGASRIHILAHSMGNRAVCDALSGLSRSAWAGAQRLRHVVLAAPDIDAGTFRELAHRICPTAHSTTLYASSRDRAILLSEKIHSYQRAGTPLVLVDGVETVDASAVDTDFLGHSFFSAARTILSDVFWLFKHDRLARERFGLQEIILDGQSYFRFKD